MSKIIIGLTGGIGSGKTTIANYFDALGVDIVDADIVARQVVEPGTTALAAIVDYFGPTVLSEDGKLNRAKLREIVFHEAENKEWLNNLLHPIIREEIAKQLNACHSPYCLLVAPLLFENGLDAQVTRSLVVDVPVDTQIERTVKRDGSNADTIKNIIAAQIPRQLRLEKADDIIDNAKTNLSTIEAHVLELHRGYLSLANTAN